MILDEFRKLVREQYEYAMTNVHICLPGKVVKYNAKTRRAEIQPCFKRKMPDGSYVNFPVVVDVPVRFFGTKKYTVHLPPEENDEVAIHFIERCTDVWKDEGHDEIEDKDPRRFNLQDCYVTLGLQPQEFIDVPEEGLVIKHWTAWDGDFISHVIMDDDKIEMKYDHEKKDKCFVLMNKDEIKATYRDKSFKDAKEDIGHVVMKTDQVMAEYKISEKDKRSQIKMDDTGTTVDSVNIDANSDNPMGVKGTKTQLGGGNLRPYWKAERSAWLSVMFIPPVPMPIAPPTGVMINMGINKVKNGIISADATANSTNSKVLK